MAEEKLERWALYTKEDSTPVKDMHQQKKPKHLQIKLNFANKLNQIPD